MQICVGKIFSWCGLNEQGLVFLNFWFTKKSKKLVVGTRAFLIYSHTIYVLYHFYDQKNILERFNDRGGAIERGRRGKYFEIQKVTKHTSKLRRILAISRRILDENPPYFACGDFLTCSIDPEWSQGLGSLKMKV